MDMEVHLVVWGKIKIFWDGTFPGASALELADHDSERPKELYCRNFAWIRYARELAERQISGNEEVLGPSSKRIKRWHFPITWRSRVHFPCSLALSAVLAMCPDRRCHGGSDERDSSHGPESHNDKGPTHILYGVQPHSLGLILPP